MTRQGEQYEHVIRPLAALKPYEKNARRHSPYQVNKLCGVIEQFGLTNPLLIDENNRIIAGHGRALACKRLGIEDVPCILVTGLTDTERQALMIADNRLGDLSSWDNELLAGELGDLNDLGFDLDLIGFSDQDLAHFLGGVGPGEGLTDPDDVPSAPVAPVSVPGDVWLLGSHRLVCGDPTDPLVVKNALNGVKPHLMVTAAPRGPKGQPEGRADWRDAWSLFPGDVAYVWCDSLHNHKVAEGLVASGLTLKSLIIWAKSDFTTSRNDYHWQHEPCWYAVRNGRKGHWSGNKKQTTLWEIDKPQVSENDLPVECMKRPIENNSSEGQAVYDPFSGSGATVIAGEVSGRIVHAIEASPRWADVTALRWMRFTGHQATLESTGQTYDDASLSRKG